VALIAVLYPLYATLSWFWRLRPQLETGESSARVRFYRQCVLELWLLTPVVLAWWFWSGRTIADVGLGVPGGWAFWVGAVVVIAAVVVLGRQVMVIRRSAEAQDQVREQISGWPEVCMITPRDARERRMFILVSLTAGFCEELLYRAFLIWYLMTWLSAPVAAAISAVVFGAAHCYLGWTGALRAAVAGLVFAVAYLVTGSLWVAVILHAALDIGSGLTMSAAFDDEGSITASASDDQGQE
jgi:membrane protease YdiL (CAAX protease family)